MITLNSNEMKVYGMIINYIIPGLAPGNYMARDFFGNTLAIPRVVRRICEEVKAGNLSKVSLIGRKSSDGYKIK